MAVPMAVETGAGPQKRKPIYAQLYVQVLVAIALGIALGHFYPQLGESLKPLGDAFIKLVKMIIAPVIFLTIVTGIAGMSDLKKVGRVAGKAMAYFLTFSTLALIVGLIVANVVKPGAGLNIDPASLDPSAVANYATKAHEQSLVGFLSNIIPTTIVDAFAKGAMLQIILISLLLGLALVQLSTGNVVVRLVLTSIGAMKPDTTLPDGSGPQPSDELKGGRLLGPLERVFILGLGLAGEVAAAGMVIAAKGLIRWPELRAKSEERDEKGRSTGIDAVTEYFLVGSFVSWLVALAALFVGWG